MIAVGLRYLMRAPVRPAAAALCVAFMVAMAASAARVHATVVVPADVAELAVEASAIAHGRVVRIEAQQGSGRRVERLVTLQVFEYFKGGWGNVVQFRTPGGTLGRYQTVMIGAPQFDEGDEVVLFLGARDASSSSSSSTSSATSAASASSISSSSTRRIFVLGLHQGVFRVVTDEASGRRVVTPPLVQGAGLGAEPGAPAARGRGDVNRRPIELREFQARIAAVLSSRGAR